MKTKNPIRGLHHVELWLPTAPDVAATFEPWAWLLMELGFELSGQWPGGQSWKVGATYISLTTSPNVSSSVHDRRQPGMNHVAFHGGTPAEVDELMEKAPLHGWVRLYHDRYPHAGGADHYAGWLENIDGYKIEVVASVEVVEIAQVAANAR